LSSIHAHLPMRNAKCEMRNARKGGSRVPPGGKGILVRELKMLAVVAVCAILALPDGALAEVRGMVRASGTLIVDAEGKPALKRGVNLGGWLLWESYLLEMGNPPTESRFKTALVKIAGRDEAYRFFRAYRDAYITEADIRRIGELGFDHVRLPINWRILADSPHFDMKPGEGWGHIDRALDWCEKAGLYVVLDLHGAPGGANAGGITDGNLKAELFEGDNADTNRRATVALWKRIAERYRGRAVVAAYDLLNEPAFNDKREASKLRAIYEELVPAVRSVDSEHMIMIEGNWWASDFGMFDKPLAANTVWHFHKYQVGTGPSMVGYLLDLADKTGCPLWLGEFGENSNGWIARVIGTVEERGIGWCYWPWKRRGGGCPQGVSIPESWRAVVSAINDGKDMDRAKVREGLDALVNALKLENCREDGSLLRALKGDEGRGPAMLPGEMLSAEYHRGRGLTPFNQGGVYRPGDMDIYNDGQGGYRVRLAPGERLEFDVEARRADTFDLSFLGAAEGEAVLKWSVPKDGTGTARFGGGSAGPRPGETSPVQQGIAGFTGGENESVSGGKVRLPAGRSVIAVEAKGEAVYLSSVRLYSCPGRIEAEDYLEEGTKDNDPANKGKEYRPSGAVDIEECSEGGYDVGWLDTGEVLAYSFEACRAGRYDLVLRTAGYGDGGAAKLILDGGTWSSGDLPLPATGWWQDWKDTVVPGIALSKGRHTISIEVVKSGFNLNYLLFVPAK